jgi:predicted AAA+ superfamily ATPase
MLICGVFRSLRPSGPLDSPAEIDGAALETLVYQHLRAWIDSSGHPVQLSFWRTNAGMEVDFIVYGKDLFYAIGVKNTARVRPEDIRGLREFADEYPEAALLFIYRGEHVLKTGNVLAMPAKKFLMNLDPGASFSSALPAC